MKAGSGKAAASARRMGLVCGVGGWTILIASALCLLAPGAPRDIAVFAAILAVAFALLMTSATLLLLDALRHGFGALDSFFVAALARASQRREEAPRPPQMAPRRRGYIRDRPFMANDDGSVTVETLLGPRRFPSLADAQDFIGS